MASALLFNRARVATATTGTGTITLGSKVSNKYATFAEAGVANTNVVTYTIEDGNDWEIGRGTYTSSGTTLSRDTVLISSVGGTVGTSKLNLSGAAEVCITAAKEDFDVNDFTEDTSPDGTADFSWMHDATAVLRKKVKPTNISRTGGKQLLVSGSVAVAAQLDLVLTSYTGYRGFILYLANFKPATDGTTLSLRVSTNGGSSYDTTGYVNAGYYMPASASDMTGASVWNATTTLVPLATGVGNETGRSYSGFIRILNQVNTSFYPRIFHNGCYNVSGGGGFHWSTGVAQRTAAQDTDAIRIFPGSGNITSMDYALYGLI